MPDEILPIVQEYANSKARGLVKFTEKVARQISVPYLGVLEDRAERTPVLKFPSGISQSKKGPAWPQVELDRIGKVTGLFAIPNSWLMGIRGERGDVLLRLIDIQTYRHLSVFKHLTGISIDS